MSNSHEYVDFVNTWTLPLKRSLFKLNCHFRGTPLEPGLPEFATHEPQGIFSGKLDDPGLIDDEEEDRFTEEDIRIALEDERITLEDERTRDEEEDNVIGIIIGRLELLL